MTDLTHLVDQKFLHIYRWVVEQGFATHAEAARAVSAKFELSGNEASAAVEFYEMVSVMPQEMAFACLELTKMLGAG